MSNDKPNVSVIYDEEVGIYNLVVGAPLSPTSK